MRTKAVRELHIILEDEEIEMAQNFFVKVYDKSLQVGFLKQKLDDDDEEIVSKFIMSIAQLYAEEQQHIDDQRGMDNTIA